MRKIYNSIYPISSIFLLVTAISSCSENEDDIAAPSITIYQPYKLLADYDTVTLTNGYLEIKIEATDNVEMNEITIGLVSLSESFSLNSNETFKPNNSKDYIYTEEYDLRGITKITKMKLSVTCTNEYSSTKEEIRYFYVKPSI